MLYLYIYMKLIKQYNAFIGDSCEIWRWGIAEKSITRISRLCFFFCNDRLIYLILAKYVKSKRTQHLKNNWIDSNFLFLEIACSSFGGSKTRNYRCTGHTNQTSITTLYLAIQLFKCNVYIFYLGYVWFHSPKTDPM